ncbi:cytochrome P450 [Nocardia sp. SYP-A9097]|uniref:cytochrome P450 n=1 Tax=Nocardia sp. SYP-A9097 TaxID=2663237 RepID=UPI001E2DF111|nr:cytochrome P450 [Nocardia sp. SYP-A9097]
MSSDQAAVAEVTPVQLAVVESIAPHMRHNPYDSYEVLRGAGPFVPGPHDTQLVTRHAEAQAILLDPRWSHAEEPELLHGDSDVELPGSFLWRNRRTIPGCAAWLVRRSPPAPSPVCVRAPKNWSAS